MRRRRKRHGVLGAIQLFALSRLTSPSQATYSETIDSSGTYAKRTIASNGCPNHYNYCTGKDGAEGCGALGEECFADGGRHARTEIRSKLLVCCPCEELL